MPIVKPSWRRTLHRTSRSSTKLHSAEILTSTSTGAYIKPLDAVLDRRSTKPIDPELCTSEKQAAYNIVDNGRNIVSSQ